MEPQIEVVKVRSLVRVRVRTRVKLWWHRRQMRRHYGQEFLDMLHEVETRVEREFLMEQEFDVQD